MALRYGTDRYGTGRYSAGTSATGVAAKIEALSGGRAYFRAKAEYAARASLTTGGRAGVSVTKRTAAQTSAASSGQAGWATFKPLAARSHSGTESWAVPAVTRPVSARASASSVGSGTPHVRKSTAARSAQTGPVMYGANLISNGDFETDFYPWYSRNGATLSVDQQALRVELTSSGNWSGARLNLSGLIPGETYRISMDILESNSANVGFGIPSKQDHYGLELGHQSHEFVADTPTEILQIGFSGFVAAGTYALFDKIKFEHKIEGARVAGVSGGYAGVTLNVLYVMGRIHIESNGRVGVKAIKKPGTLSATQSAGGAAATTLRRSSARSSTSSAGRAGVNYITHLAALGGSVSDSSARARRRRKLGALGTTESVGRVGARVSRTAGLGVSSNESVGVAGVKRIRGVCGQTGAVSGHQLVPKYVLGAGARSATESSDRIAIRVSFKGRASIAAVSGSRASLTNLWRIQNDAASPWTLVGHPHDEFRGTR